MRLILFILILGFLGCTKQNVQPENILITIDDAPNFPENTKKMVDVLNKYNTKAIFFCVGSYMKEYPDVVQYIVSSEHILGNHSYTHSDLTTLSMDSVISEVLMTETEINKFQASNKYFRAPYGSITLYQRTKLMSLGYKYIDWGCDASDWSNDVSLENIQAYYNKLLDENKLHNKTILFHLSDNSILGLDWLLNKIYHVENNNK